MIRNLTLALATLALLAGTACGSRSGACCGGKADCKGGACTEKPAACPADCTKPCCAKPAPAPAK